MLFTWGDIPADAWAHLLNYVLPGAALNTLLLVIAVSLLSLVTGCGLAALVVFYEFPGRNFFKGMVILPLAFPAYVYAFIFTGIFEYSGPFFTFVRNHISSSFWFPVRSFAGLVIVMSLALYPYVYLMSCQGFRSQGCRAMEAGRVMGVAPARLLLRLVMPLSWPWIAGGVIIVAMECLADFGTVSVFSIDTMTTAVYKAWFGLFARDLAGQISTLFLVPVVLLLFLSSLNDKKIFSAVSFEAGGFRRQPLTGTAKWSAACFFTLFCGFTVFMPLLRLITWGIRAEHGTEWLPFLGLIKNTLQTGILGGALCLSLALILVLANRLKHFQATDYWWSRLALTGYGIPGNILAVGIFVPLAWADKNLIDPLFPGNQFVAGSSLMAVLLGMAVRFTGVSFTSVSAGMKRIQSELTGAGRILGLSPYKMTGKVYLPLLRPACLTGFILAAVDIMKEMPLTLMLRPVGGDTLAVRIFELTSEGEWERAAWPALALLGAGLGPVILLLMQERSDERKP